MCPAPRPCFESVSVVLLSCFCLLTKSCSTSAPGTLGRVWARTGVHVGRFFGAFWGVSVEALPSMLWAIFEPSIMIETHVEQPDVRADPPPLAPRPRPSACNHVVMLSNHSWREITFSTHGEGSCFTPLYVRAGEPPEHHQQESDYIALNSPASGSGQKRERSFQSHYSPPPHPVTTSRAAGDVQLCQM